MRTEVYQSNQTSHPFRCRLLRGDQPSTSMSILQAGLGSSYCCAWVVNIRAEQPGLPKVDSTEMLLPDVPELGNGPIRGDESRQLLTISV